MGYSHSGASATVAQDGAIRNAGTSYRANVGDQTWRVTANGVGTIRLIFTVVNGHGLERARTVTINVASGDLAFTATGAQTEAEVGETVGIDFNIGESALETRTYRAVYTGDLEGTLRYNGNAIPRGSSFTIVSGNSWATYTGRAEGSHNIDFTVTSSSGKTKMDNVQIDFSSLGSAIEEILWTLPAEANASLFTINRNNPTVYKNTFRTNAAYAPLRIKATVVSYTPGAGGRAITVKDILINFKSKISSILDQFVDIPNDIPFHVVTRLVYDSGNPDYEGAEVLIRFTIKNTQTSITRETLFGA